MKRPRLTDRVPFGCCRLATRKDSAYCSEKRYCLVQTETYWSLCRLIDELGAEQIEVEVECDVSVGNEGVMELPEHLVGERYPISFLTRCGQEDRVWRFAVHVHQQLNQSSQTEAFFIILASDPIILSSVALSYTSCEKSSSGLENQPLLLACLKRQLAGTAILPHTKINLSFEGSWNFTVTRYLPSTAPFGIILPSTSTTMLPQPDVDMAAAKLSSLRISDETLSPTTQFLIDTIHCVSQSGDVPRSVLLTSPPGCGKTFAVRSAIEHTDAQLIDVRGSELTDQSSHPSEAAIQLYQLFLKAVQMSQTGDSKVVLIFLDECDALVGANVDKGGSTCLEAMLCHLLDRMNTDLEWKRLMVVAATNRVDCLSYVLRRPGRFDREIILDPPDATARLCILKAMIGIGHDDRALQTIADECVGYVPADLAALVRRAKHLQILQLQQGSLRTEFTDLLKQAKEDVGASALRDAAMKTPPKMSWNDVAGDPGRAKTLLRQAIEWPRTKSQAFQALGLTAPRGILLHGPPGCAKTTLARAAAGSIGVAFLSFSPADVYSSSYVGEAEAVVRRAFTLARSASPCVLFFDEIDAILGCDDSSPGHGMGRSSSTSAEARVLSTFLNEMDGIEGSHSDGVLVLGATNRPQALDAALLRPGRFDKVIYVPPPDFEGRLSILKMQCEHWETVCTDWNAIDIDQLATMSKNMTGAEIVGACREAFMMALRESIEELSMKQEYLFAAFNNVKPLLSNPSVLTEYQAFEEQRKQT